MNRILSVALLCAFAAASVADDGWSVGGDLRGGYLTAETTARDGAVSDSDGVRARARVHLRGRWSEEWGFGGRVAAVFDTRQSGSDLWLRGYAPGPLGLSPGQATIDDFHLDHRPAGSAWSFRYGRFQAAFGLKDVMKKSLDHNDSPSFDVTWTDGLYAKRSGADWTTHVIVRHNHERGPTGPLRGPLDFGDSGARLGLFVALEAEHAIGPLIQRTFTLTVLPSALPTATGTSGYLAATAKGTLEWPLGASGRRFRLGTELGFAPDTPAGTDGLGWQVSFNLMDAFPRHDFAIVHGRVADGWLLSADFTPNDSLIEARWVWRVNGTTTVDARVRRREEIDLPVGSTRERVSDDANIRVSWRF